MKKILFISVMIFVISCSQSSKYDKLIIKYAQTNKQGVFTDCKFKVINIKELPPITVSDSVAILKKEFEENNIRNLELQESLLKYSKENLRREESSRFKIQKTINLCNQSILNAERKIDSIKQLQFTCKYDNMPSNKILSQPVECHYSYIFPEGSSRQERTDIFYFTSDNSKITYRQQVKK